MNGKTGTLELTSHDNEEKYIYLIDIDQSDMNNVEMMSHQKLKGP